MAKKTWDEKLAALSEELEKLSKKTATAAEDAKAVRELKEDALKEMISDTKGDIAAMQENLRIADEENKSKLSSALLKAQMTVRAKIEDHKVARDKKLFEAYINDQIDYILDCYDSAAWLIANAQLAILETMDAVIEYDAKYGEKTEEAPAEEKPEA
ncbi:MAG: hypothetical protein IJG94_05645 [Clostridia bacterium]|jgi:hypothetical protein|nr:hypothetical protein [Clostridia bacterium]